MQANGQKSGEGPGGSGRWPNVSKLVGWVLEGDHHTLFQIREHQAHMIRVVSHFLHLHQKRTFLQDEGRQEGANSEFGGGSRGVSGDSGGGRPMGSEDGFRDDTGTERGDVPLEQGRDASQEGETTNWDGRKRGNKRNLPLPEHIRPTTRSVLPGQSAPKRLECIVEQLHWTQIALDSCRLTWDARKDLGNLGGLTCLLGRSVGRWKRSLESHGVNKRKGQSD